MVTVEMKMLPREANAAADFLRSKIKSQITIRGKEIQIDAESADEVKFLIKKFLHREGLESYTVLSESGALRVVREGREEPVRKDVEDKVKEIPPFPPLSSERLPLIQTVYPNYGSSPILPPERKKKRNCQQPSQETAYGGAGGI